MQLCLLLWMIVLVWQRIIVEENRMKLVLIVSCRLLIWKNSDISMVFSRMKKLVVMKLDRKFMFLWVVSIQVDRLKNIRVVMVNVEVMMLLLLGRLRYMLRIGLSVQFMKLVRVKVLIRFQVLLCSFMVRKNRLQKLISIMNMFGQGRCICCEMQVIRLLKVRVSVSRLQVLCRMLLILCCFVMVEFS